MRATAIRQLAAATLLLLGIVMNSAAQTPATPPEHRRREEQTFLTYPEWFLVHSPAEYADFVKAHPPSEFPFWGHIGQLWGSYAAVTRETNAANYPFNLGYHVMIMVIGVSTTVEYALRSIYETIVGRLAELTAGRARTEEDEFGAHVAQDYVDFIRVRPWYEYDFLSKLKRLWTDTGLFGPGLLRKWERKYALTTEYAIKAAYGWLIMKATKASYDAASPVTVVVLDRAPVLPMPAPLDVKLLAEPAVLSVPRYAGFKGHALALARQGANFREVAGNAAAAQILLTVLVPPGWQIPHERARAVFTQTILTRPERTRVAVSVPLGDLAELLRRLHAGAVDIEHIYDY